MKKSSMIIMIIVAVIGVLTAGMLGWLVGLWVASESDFGFEATGVGWVLGVIGGTIIAIRWIKPIKVFKRFKRDAKRNKRIKRSNTNPLSKNPVKK